MLEASENRTATGAEAGALRYLPLSSAPSTVNVSTRLRQNSRAVTATHTAAAIGRAQPSAPHERRRDTSSASRRVRKRCRSSLSSRLLPTCSAARRDSSAMRSTRSSGFCSTILLSSYHFAPSQIFAQRRLATGAAQHLLARAQQLAAQRRFGDRQRCRDLQHLQLLHVAQHERHAPPLAHTDEHALERGQHFLTVTVADR